MKIINEIRYFLFAVMVLGCFANFAQNEYGLHMLYDSQFLIAFIFFIEAFIFYFRNRTASKTKAIYLFWEHFFIGMLFIGQYLKWESTLASGPFLFFGAFFLFMMYFIYAIRTLTKDFKKGALLSFVIFIFILETILSVNGLAWKLQHLPGSRLMMGTAFFVGLALIALALIKRKYKYQGQFITLKDRIMKIPGKMPMVFLYFTIWVSYISLIIIGVVPNFYTLSSPPAFEKMKAANNPKADLYNNNYYKFLGNRNHIRYR